MDSSLAETNVTVMVCLPPATCDLTTMPGSLLNSGFWVLFASAAALSSKARSVWIPCVIRIVFGHPGRSGVVKSRAVWEEFELVCPFQAESAPRRRSPKGAFKTPLNLPCQPLRVCLKIHEGQGIKPVGGVEFVPWRYRSKLRRWSPWFRNHAPVAAGALTSRTFVPRPSGAARL